jgi:hypothetical protein
MSSFALHPSRGRQLAAKRREAASSVAPVASGYERSLGPSLACFSRLATTIWMEDER